MRIVSDHHRKIERLFLNFIFEFKIGCHDPDARADYTALNLNIEKVSKFLDFFLIKVAIAGYAPSSLFLTLVNYFVLDLDTESYHLITPMWYVWDNNNAIERGRGGREREL